MKLIVDAKTGEETRIPFTPEEEAERAAAHTENLLNIPLSPYQFHAMVDIIEEGGRPLNISAVINSIPDVNQRAVARGKYNYATSYNRYDTLTVSMSASAGITPEEMDAYWLQGLEL